MGHAGSPLSMLLLQLLAIVGLSRLLGLVARRLGQPLVIAEICAGILLGPSFLKIFAPNFVDWLFTPESLRVVKILSELGLVLFMFVVGLELKPEQLRVQGRSAVVISHTSIVVPFVLGAMLAFPLHAHYAPPGVRLLPFALFVGIAMSITAFPVLARILQEKDLLKTPLGMTAIACAAVDDVTAWCLLAVVVAAVRADGLANVGLTVALTLVFIAVMWFVVRPIFGAFAERLSKGQNRITDRLTTGVIAVTLMTVLASAWLTEFIGVHALFGAFLLGAILPRSGSVARALTEKLETVPSVLWMPLFFAYSGLRTQINLLSSSTDWLVLVAIILVATLGKFGGSSVAARLTGQSARDATAIGLLMNTRGLMELIVLNVGLDLGVLTPTLFTIMVIMALVTTFMTSPLLKYVAPQTRA